MDAFLEFWKSIKPIGNLIFWVVEIAIQNICKFATKLGVQLTFFMKKRSKCMQEPMPNRCLFRTLKNLANLLENLMFWVLGIAIQNICKFIAKWSVQLTFFMEKHPKCMQKPMPNRCLFWTLNNLVNLLENLTFWVVEIAIEKVFKNKCQIDTFS